MRAGDGRCCALYFGRRANMGGALFGWYHPPVMAEGGSIGVVLCPPLGYEGICAYPALRCLAEALSAAGYPVLRFDYEGCGDSGGLDSDAARVQAWIDSVHDAIDELRAQSGAYEICVIGVRAGATLAAVAASERDDINRVILWSACSTGRSYLREMKAFRMLAEHSGEMSFKPRAKDDKSQESGSFLFSAETVSDLCKLNLLKLRARIAERVLILHRDDIAADDRLTAAIAASGAKTVARRLAGYADMMASPDKSQLASPVVETVLEWLAGPPAPPVAIAPVASTAQTYGVVAPGVREELLRFGPQQQLVGILTCPAEAREQNDAPLIIFCNTAGNHRIGPSRMYVEMGRAWAARGLSSLRIDVSGVGDSIIHQEKARNHPYHEQLIADATAAIEAMKRRGVAERFLLLGLCSGAFVAYHTALAEPCVSGLVLINLQTFKWEDGMSLDVNRLKVRQEARRYWRRMLEPEAWRSLLRGRVDVRHFMRTATERMTDVAHSARVRLSAWLPSEGARLSEVAQALDSLTRSGTDVRFVFSSDDPGIDNLSEAVGAHLPALAARPNFDVTVIEGPDHSFTPLWAQQELSAVLTSHLAGAAAEPPR